jgi:hypothetical protein
MMPEFYIFLAVAIALMMIGRVVWRRSPKTADWELIVAFIRLDFPPVQRDLAQKIAAGLAEIVGDKIKELRPEHTLGQIANWADNRIYTADLIQVLHLAYGVICESNTSFRAVVEQAATIRAKNGEIGEREWDPKGAT